MTPYFLRFILPPAALALVVACVFDPHTGVAGTDASGTPPAAAISVPVAAPELKQGEVGSYLAGRYARQRGDADAASYYFSHSLANDPYDENLMKQAVRTHVLAGRVEDAAHIAGNLSALYDGTQVSHLVLLAHSMRNNDFATARKELLAMEGFGLFSVIQPVLEGWVSFAESGTVKPIVLNEHIKQLMVFDPFITFQNALLFDVAGNVGEAQKYYEAATQDISGMSYRNLLTMMDFYRRYGHEEKARALFDRYVVENRTTQVVEGETYETVIKDLQRADGKPFIASAVEGLAEELFAVAGMLYGENVTAETQLYLRLALYLRPDMAEGQLMLGSILEEEGTPQKALAFYDAIADTGPLNRRAQIRKAFILAEMNRSGEALKLLEGLTEKYPQSADVRITQGDVYRKESQFSKAVESYSAALEIKGEKLEEYHWPILYARGISYERDGEWDKAENDFKAALALYPDQPDVLNYLGYSWLMKGTNLEQAKQMLEQAVAERPEDAHIVDSMGWALYKLGDYKGALEYLEQAVDLMPSDPVVNDHYGDALWRNGRHTEARFQWDRALFFKPEDVDRERIEAKLKSGLADDASATAPKRFNTAGE